MTVEGVGRSVLADQIRDHLLQEILAGRYQPHMRLVETRIARDLGTSQAPVREALRGLEAIGVVEILPFRGARVRRPSADQLLEAYVVRSDLEALAVRLGLPKMTAADLDELIGLGDEMQAAAAAGDRHRVAIADATFHARLVHLARNSVLERVWQQLEPFSRTYLTLLVPGADPDWTVSLHAPILAALRARDVAAMVAALEGHFEEAAAKLARNWPDEAPPDQRPDQSSPDRPPPEWRAEPIDDGSGTGAGETQAASGADRRRRDVLVG